MLLRCLVLVFCLTATLAQKGGSPFEPVRSPSRLLAGRKLPQASETVQQVQEPEDDRDPEEDREVVIAARPQRPRVPAPRPRDPESEAHEPAPEPYSFKYAVDDPETGAATSREETQDANGEVVGYYHIQDAEGRSRRVDYTAGKDGFKATIKSNEEGLNSRSPADVRMEHSASEHRATWAPNNRPLASESSLKSVGRLPPPERFFQRLIPAPIAPQPIPAPPAPVETQRIEQVLEQRAEDPAQEAQISQSYETSDPQDLQEIVQQRNVDVEEAFESAPPTPRPPIKGLISPPIQSNVIQPFVQRVSQPVVQIQRPIGQFNPSRIQTFREQGIVGLQRLPQPIAQAPRGIALEYPNLYFQEQQQQSFEPIPVQPLPTRPLPAQPINSGYTLSVQHRETGQYVQQPRQPVFQAQERIVEQPVQVRQLVAPPAPQPQQINLQPFLPYQYKPLPNLQPQVQRLESRQFEPQTYETIEQSYEPLTQQKEDPAEESRIAPPCKCADQAESNPQPVKGLEAPTEPQPVKSVSQPYLSPARSFIPQAFRSSSS